MHFHTYHLVLGVAALAPTVFSKDGTGNFPAVDLGYAVHVPTSVNQTDSSMMYANYNNIRFAEPPLGSLRFRRPEPPLRQHGIQNGSTDDVYSTSCVGSVPPEFPSPPLNGTAWGREDCLFLNVRVPEGIKPGEKVPVLHWLYGSGYGFGSKDISGDSLGVYDELYAPTQKFIYVASNYRMGLFGWASTPDEDMDANVGLYDAMAAVEWTREHISKFGGDPQRITVMGESAGAGLVTLMLVSNGGKGKLPFQQAFISSPGIWPRREPSHRQEVYDEVLKTTGCNSLACLRDASEDLLFDANKYLINNRSTDETGAFGPGIGFVPVVDGDLIPDLVNVLFKTGHYHRELKQVVVGHMVHETAIFPFNHSMPEQFPEIVRDFIPKADDATIERIKSIYDVPPDNPEMLSQDWFDDVIFSCNTYHIAESYRHIAKRYYMSIPPAAHGQDMMYYFYYDDALTPVASVPLARQFQEYLRRFITHQENPDQKFWDLPKWPSYDGIFSNATSFNITLNGFEAEPDEWVRNGRCEVLYDVISDPRNGA